MFPNSNQLHREPFLPIIRTCPEFTEPGPDSTLDYRRKASKINHRGPGEIKTLQSCGSFSASSPGLAVATKRHRWNNDNCLEGRPKFAVRQSASHVDSRRPCPYHSTHKFRGAS